MKDAEIEKYLKDKAEKFGYVEKAVKSSGEIKGNALYRKYSPNTHFLAFVRLEEPNNGAYSDLSFVMFFPSEESADETKGSDNNDEADVQGDDSKNHNKDKDGFDWCVVSIGVGTNLFSRDTALAMLPGTRRMYQKLMGLGSDSTSKLSFTDTTTYSEDFFASAEKKGIYIEERYKPLLPAASIIGLKKDSKGNIPSLDAWLAQYAIMRQWNWEGSGKRANTRIKLANEREAAVQAIAQCSGSPINDLINVTSLLRTRKYVVLQGAPGTGKTKMANDIANNKANNYEKIIFTQFHAETTYSDFVNGIEIDLDESKKKGQTVYKAKTGALCEAIREADNGKKVLLIIDEINRANLANVLGPVFYLFEKSAGNRAGNISVNGKEYSELPSNISVIATMNTADRSLAVVDFALRRRFAWYTLKPHDISQSLLPGQCFQKHAFEKISKLFEKYATDEELNLQPGQYYFITNDTEPSDPNSVSKEMIEILNYELMPLMKEYFEEGYLLKLRDEFASLYLKWTGRYMYE